MLNEDLKVLLMNLFGFAILYALLVTLFILPKGGDFGYQVGLFIGAFSLPVIICFILVVFIKILFWKRSLLVILKFASYGTLFLCIILTLGAIWANFMKI